MGIKAAVMVPHPPLIVPEVGKGQEKEIQNTIDAYHKAAKLAASFCPDTIVVISPHQTMYADYFHISPGKEAEGDFAQFSAGQVKISVTYDTELVDGICKAAKECRLSAGTMGEREKRLDHGTMVPLYFINQYCPSYKLVRIGLSGLMLEDHYRLGECIKKAAEQLKRNVVLVGSGDLSHRLKEDGPYGFRKEGPEYDKRIMDVMGRAAFGELFDFSEELLEGAGECGHRSFVILAGALDRTEVATECLSYEGPFGVGYGICTYEVEGRDEKRNFCDAFERILMEKLAKQREREDAYVRLARRTVEEYVKNGGRPEPPSQKQDAAFLEAGTDGLSAPEEMLTKRAGTFVSIHEHGRLRGCIGTIQATCSCIAEEIIQNAISASTKDPRFSPITPEELKYLEISVDVLGDTEKIDSVEKLDVKRYGVIVTKGRKRGLLLPNLDGVDTIDQQVAIAKRKAGIREEDEDVELERFEVVRHV